MRRLLPQSAAPDAVRLIGTRAARGFADGIASVLLASYLSRLGFTPVQIGAIATATLFGSAALLLAVGLLGHRFPRRTVLLASAGLMCATGVAFYFATGFWALVLVAFLGTLNPSSGDVTLFLPTEQAVLAESAAPQDRTILFAWYNLAGAFAGAFGSLAAGLPDALAPARAAQAERAAFLVYGALGALSAFAYRKLSPHLEPPRSAETGAALKQSRGVVLQLATLFSVDAFGGGFVVQSIVALWLFRRFDLAVGTAGAIFFAVNLLCTCARWCTRTCPRTSSWCWRGSCRPSRWRSSSSCSGRCSRRWTCRRGRPT